MKTSISCPKQKIRRRRPLTAAAIAAAFSFLALTASASAADVTVVYTGETHAMLHPCDCPDDPGGGLAERAGFLNGAADRGGLLLLDGGGFSGGGIYDTYSQGRAADSARTAKTIAAMGLMGYDAAGVGDDDLQYGGAWLVDQAKAARLPLVCANCFTADGKYLVSPYVIVKKGDNTFAVTSVVTSERLFPIDTAVVIKDPFASIEKIRKEMKRKSGYQILLSHLGEEETGTLLKRLPGFTLAANGHRKMSVQPLVNIYGTPTLFFGFQGKSMSYATLGWKNRSLRLAGSGWFRIDAGAGADARVAAVVGKPAAAPKPEPSKTEPKAAEPDATATAVDDGNRVYDLYIMSLCPYGIRALADLAELIRAFPLREWNVWFIGTAEGDKLTSLRGEDEIFDETLWLALKALYPFRYHEFLYLRSGSQASTEEILDEMGLDVGKIRHWADDMGRSELRQHYLRSMRLNVNASPALFINNKLFDKPMGGGRLVREECRAAEVEPPFCNNYPECFEDGDCQAKGKVGKCLTGEEVERAVCEFRDDASFALTVLAADSALGSLEKQPLEALIEILPGARVSVVKFSSEEGRRVMARHAPSALPFFHFDKNVENAQNFLSVSETLEGADGGYRFKKGAVKENFFPLRPEKQGIIELYADPLMPDIGKVINVLVSNPDLAKRVSLRPVILKSPNDANQSLQDKLRAEEALRWIVLADEFPKKYHAYIKLYGENAASSYWTAWLKKIGVNQKKFIKRVEANKPRLTQYWDDFAAVSLGEPVVVLINNRAKIAVSNERELERVLKSISY